MTNRWRIVDIVVAAVLGVAFGAVFQAWNLVWAAAGPLFVAFPPAQGLMYGIWMLPAVLVPLIVQRPGAALFAEVVAALAEVLFGAPWGALLLVYGIVQGGAAEATFAIGGYRRWGPAMAVAAAAAVGGAAALADRVFYYPTWDLTFTLAYVAFVAISAAVVAGLGSWLLVRLLSATGVLAPFPGGRSQRPV